MVELCSSHRMPPLACASIIRARLLNISVVTLVFHVDTLLFQIETQHENSITFIIASFDQISRQLSQYFAIKSNESCAPQRSTRRVRKKGMMVLSNGHAVERR